MPTMQYPHIDLSRETPYLEGTQTKVVEVILDRLAHHWDADEIHRQHPDLSLAQIYSALAYYHDHQEEMDRQIAERVERETELLSELGGSALRVKLQMLRRRS
jgi:uncharacterized protein (DUF433 family)